MAPRVPDWTDNQIIAARKVYRRNGSLQEAMDAMGEKVLTKDGARNRLKRLGMTFYDMPSSHLGTSKSVDVSRKFKF